MESTKNSFDHSTQTLISDHRWFGAMGVGVLQSHSSRGAAELSLESPSREGTEGSGSLGWHLIVTLAPSASCLIHLDPAQCLRNSQTRQNGSAKPCCMSTPQGHLLDCF